jgi:hypothetical protein
VLYEPEFPARVQEVARGWNKLQLGMLGFSGLCGVLQSGSGASRPMWLQQFGAISAVSGLVMATLAVFIVGGVAIPITGLPGSPVQAARRLHVGIVLSFVAVLLTAVSALSLWWPTPTESATGRTGEKVVVTTDAGIACGAIVDGGSGFIDIDVNGSAIRLPLSRVRSVKPTASC